MKMKGLLKEECYPGYEEDVSVFFTHKFFFPWE